MTRGRTSGRDAAGGFIATGVLDANGCAYLPVPLQFRYHLLQTRIFYMDVGRFYGGYYNGRSYYAIAYYGQWPIDYGTSTGGWATAGQELWYLYGTVSCSGCRWS